MTPVLNPRPYATTKRRPVKSEANGRSKKKINYLLLWIKTSRDEDSKYLFAHTRTHARHRAGFATTDDKGNRSINPYQRRPRLVILPYLSQIPVALILDETHKRLRGRDSVTIPRIRKRYRRFYLAGQRCHPPPD